MSLIWATRGRAWGFKFLRDGGFEDPLPVYQEAFAGLEDEPEVCRRASHRVALRFLDPEGRTDRAGRVIPHDFVISGAPAEVIESVADGLQIIWPQVADEYARDWPEATS
ncbi:hypothetical protein [Arthrobacter sp. Edens01]|uniref:hypothetical protein n=1 Tax=unclassified Arthrobacter TaxID=235627 RepID=UPI0006DAD58D|nr:hypothetical protein [Arthrobacter sp. Edens01]KPN19395.1 hypothetical protein AO716_06325 [Arthrobacter sp. Edens01]